MQEYVAGLLYSDMGDRVALVKKNRPEWQAGYYNAIGGKIEPGETSQDAMRREFLEEAGVDVEWDFRFTLGNDRFKVHFYSAFSDELLLQVTTLTDEPIEVVYTSYLPHHTIQNVTWIVPLLKDHTVEVPIFFKDVAGN